MTLDRYDIYHGSKSIVLSWLVDLFNWDVVTADRVPYRFLLIDCPLCFGPCY